MSWKFIYCVSVSALILGCHTSKQIQYADGYIYHPEANEYAETLVGVDYFAGWWEEKPNKWEDRFDGHNWLDEYPQREPLLGMYNSQATMDREIIAAAEHGIDFFMMLWYFMPPGKSDSWYSHSDLNKGFELFMKSPQANRMKFCIEFCNHSPHGVKTEKDWRECVDTWTEIMKHPSYLRIGGRLLFKVHGCGTMWSDCGNSLERVAAWIEILRNRVRQEGLGEMIIGAGNPGVTVWQDHWAGEVFDFSCDYMSFPKYLEKKNECYKYDKLATHLQSIRAGHRFDTIPYMPFIAAGFDPSPWKDERPAFMPPTREQWKRELRFIAKDLNNIHNLGVPLPDGQLCKIFTIYAWNEFGEGGYIAPTEGDKYFKLECIRETFGVKKFRN